MNILERSIAAISPNWAAKRTRDRLQLDVLRKYESGSNSALTKGIDRQVRSAVADSIDTLDNNKGFSRELERNDPIVKRALEILTSHTIGTGIRPAIKGKQAKRAKEIWAKWAETTECDVEGLNNIYGIQELAAMTMFRDGEVLVLKKTNPAKDAIIPIQLQVLECDYLDGQKTIGLENGGEIVQGVEFNAKGKRVAYWLHQAHPNDSYLRPSAYGSVRIPAKNVLHMFKQERAGQVRGTPAGVQAFISANEIKDYLFAQALKQKISATFVGAITTPEDALCNPNAPDSIGTRMQPGTLQYLKPGEQLQFSDPPSVEGIDAFLRAVHFRIAGAYGITYESLTNDYGNVNFSSGRMGWVEQSRNIQRIQTRQVFLMLLDPIYSWIMMASELEGNTIRDTSVSWTPQRREMIDPVKELQATKELLRMGLSSEQEAAREQGWDLDQLREERLEDAKWNDAHKLQPTTDQRYDPESRRIDSEDARAKLQFNSAKT